MEDTTINEELINKVKEHHGAYIYGDSFTGKTTLAKLIVEKLAAGFCDANRQISIDFCDYPPGNWRTLVKKIKLIDNFDMDPLTNTSSWVSMFDISISCGIIIICGKRPPSKYSGYISNRLLKLLAIKLTKVHTSENEEVVL